MGGADDHSRRKIEENFEKRAVFREERKKARESGEPLGDLSWLARLPEAKFREEWDKIEARLTQELESAKLWHSDHDKCMIPNENGIPSAVKNRLYAQEDEESGEDFLDLDGIYDPEWVDEVLESGILPEDVDLLDENEPELVITDEWDLRLLGPKAPFSNLQILMRRRPKDLSQSLARALAEAGYFLKNEPQALLPALCFYEVGIEDESTFTDIRAQVYAGGPYHLAGKEFSFTEYQRDKLKISHVIRKQKQGYFDHNRPVWRAAARVAPDPSVALKSLWERFLAVHRALTPKQRNAVKEVHIKGRPQTKVAEGMRITLDSLRDRLEGARIKFQNALPELAPFKPSETYKRSRKRTLLYWGLFDKSNARIILPALRLTKTGEAIELIPPIGKPKKKPGVNLPKIKAWAYASTPVPDFGFTDYFTKLIPKGHMDRISSAPTPHDRGAGFPNYDNKNKARILTSSPDETEEEE